MIGDGRYVVFALCVGEGESFAPHVYVGIAAMMFSLLPRRSRA